MANKQLVRRGEKQERESAKMANLLLFLASGAGVESAGKSGGGDHPGNSFKCKTCSRRFPTFQALGGHCTSHKRLRVRAGASMKPKRSSHACPVCGLEFLMGQALGGHMRRHKPAAAGDQKKASAGGEHGQVVVLDLNLPPLVDDALEPQELKLGVQLVDFLKLLT